mmetsp:Transcript_35195/g.74584  ORF Transcript_35195/g.74584 Transcript_35195/m.74584 type:complete len:202 (+) Transcript_35195:1925-2530(+)
MGTSPCLVAARTTTADPATEAVTLLPRSSSGSSGISTRSEPSFSPRTASACRRSLLQAVSALSCSSVRSNTFRVFPKSSRTERHLSRSASTWSSTSRYVRLMSSMSCCNMSIFRFSFSISSSRCCTTTACSSSCPLSSKTAAAEALVERLLFDWARLRPSGDSKLPREVNSVCLSISTSACSRASARAKYGTSVATSQPGA